jgi:GNAT superfamily N-acetyltransferase
MITYRREQPFSATGPSPGSLDLDQAIELYRASTLGLRRPVDDRVRMAKMLEHGNLTFTAWDGERLVGIARSLSDFSFCTYCSDLAVHLDYQRQGVGKELLRLTQEAGLPGTLYLFAAPAAVDYYPHIGFEAGSGWILTSNRRIVSST